MVTGDIKISFLFVAGTWHRSDCCFMCASPSLAVFGMLSIEKSHEKYWMGCTLFFFGVNVQTSCFSRQTLIVFCHRQHWPMCAKAKGTPRDRKRKKTPASKGYPLSVFNKTLLSQDTMCADSSNWHISFGKERPPKKWPTSKCNPQIWNIAWDSHVRIACGKTYKEVIQKSA